MASLPPATVSLASATVQPIALATPLALYIVFERMFQVSLPHGELAAALGY